ncbi:hypothetical protein Val02_72920 [Virgisporangium aliadipatigenens]|uniref:Fibronectin type-III domain-containing protein n=1 Tax=Virgisporangium aliadipatigenens TaxID=741659 RepID=A0A8J3YV73_9ACTN|nr:fibronectin type III domain-containing protein [Virgisporangium aliadipatigenens]GIJ50406.1 hypothetical protein Val02_72920 [Virgisporangium aliadipatigenens]
MRRRLAAVAALCLLLAGAVPGSAAAAPAGPPPRPAPPGTPAPSLTDHPLTAAPSPLDNPLKGFGRFYNAGENQNTGYPRSLAWSYFGLSEVMTSATNCTAYDWSIVDSALNETASYGNQAAIRFYLEYPGGTGSHPGNAVPHCFDGHVAYRDNTYWGTVSPDYDSPYLLDAVSAFIAALGARYDGDPRIGFIHLGIVGLWGEWHTWPFDTDTGSDSYPNLMPTDANGARIVRAFDEAFDTTKLEIRYPDSAGGAANTRDIGYHDDSFCYREGSPLQGVTLPQSLGGASYSQLTRALATGTENKWITSSMGGEVRPEIQASAFASWPGGSGQVDNLKACIELEHTTWKINQGSQNYAASDPNVAAAVRLMGYDLTATNAYYQNSVTGNATVGVKLVNNGVAPFYYPWTVALGLKDSTGAVVRTWDTPWDLRSVQPLRIRAFPEWGVGADPTYRDFGHPQYFQSNVSLTGVAAGSYQLVMRVKNPLEALSPAAKKLRFGNTTQHADGWLGLGAIGVGTGGDTTAPSAPTGLASPAQTSTSISLSWNAATDNVGVTGYRVLRGGTQVATTSTPSYVDTGLTAGTSYTYAVQAVDAAGNASPASTPLSVSTPGAAGRLLDDFDGTPPYPAAARNDLGAWTGGNGFTNGGGNGVVSGGALTLRYANGGWLGSDVPISVSSYTHLVIRVKGSVGGEQSHFSLGLGGTTKLFADYVLDGGGRPVLTTGYQEIRIPMAANGIDRAAPGQLAMGFWFGGNSAITIDSVSFR